ncbi:MAG TPA: hypothetical protein VF405_12685 [Gammaproteobacteria bacterium]
MLKFLPLALLVAVLCAPSSNAQPPEHATRLTSISPAHCVATLDHHDQVDPLRCPAALRNAIIEARDVCRDAGGKLAGLPEGEVWAIDVNGDRRNELAFDLESNVSCADAWSVFSCGSLGCPKALYELRGREWTVVGGISAASPQQVALGADRSADGHRTLEVCSEDRCAERWTYEWQGKAYEVTHGDVRGARVEIASSAQGLHPLTAATTVRATPRSSGDEVGHYDAGIEVAIIGTVESGDWYYVSPCNACKSGFVPKSAVAIP